PHGQPSLDCADCLRPEGNEPFDSRLWPWEVKPACFEVDCGDRQRAYVVGAKSTIAGQECHGPDARTRSAKDRVNLVRLEHARAVKMLDLGFVPSQHVLARSPEIAKAKWPVD